MMKLRLFLRNSARVALISLIVAINLALLPGCSAPTGPTYTQENICFTFEKILKEEYEINSIAKLSGQTLWIYIPLEESIVIESDKPEEYVRKFQLESLEGGLKDERLNFSYGISEIPDTKESQKTKFNPDAFDKLNKVLRVARRILFSLEQRKYGPRFFVTVMADTKNGIELIYKNYVDDFKKASYGLISWVEYQHRMSEDIKFSPDIIGDLEGKHLRIYDIDFKEFLIEQIKQRIRIKFNRPEVNKGVDINKEVLKSIKQVVEIYNFKDFLFLDLKDVATGFSTSLSRASVAEGIKD